MFYFKLHTFNLALAYLKLYTFAIVKSCCWPNSLFSLFNINVHAVTSGTGEEEKNNVSMTEGNRVYGNLVLIATDITLKHNLKRSFLSL